MFPAMQPPGGTARGTETRAARQDPDGEKKKGKKNTRPGCPL